MKKTNYFSEIKNNISLSFVLIFGVLIGALFLFADDKGILGTLLMSMDFLKDANTMMYVKYGVLAVFALLIVFALLNCFKKKIGFMDNLILVFDVALINVVLVDTWLGICGEKVSLVIYISLGLFLLFTILRMIFVKEKNDDMVNKKYFVELTKQNNISFIYIAGAVIGIALGYVFYNLDLDALVSSNVSIWAGLTSVNKALIGRGVGLGFILLTFVVSLIFHKSLKVSKFDGFLLMGVISYLFGGVYFASNIDAHEPITYFDWLLGLMAFLFPLAIRSFLIKNKKEAKLKPFTNRYYYSNYFEKNSLPFTLLLSIVMVIGVLCVDAVGFDGLMNNLTHLIITGCGALIFVIALLVGLISLLKNKFKVNKIVCYDGSLNLLSLFSLMMVFVLLNKFTIIKAVVAGVLFILTSVLILMRIKKFTLEVVQEKVEVQEDEGKIEIVDYPTEEPAKVVKEEKYKEQTYIQDKTDDELTLELVDEHIEEVKKKPEEKDIVNYYEPVTEKQKPVEKPVVVEEETVSEIEIIQEEIKEEVKEEKPVPPKEEKPVEKPVEPKFVEPVPAPVEEVKEHVEVDPNTLKFITNIKFASDSVREYYVSLRNLLLSYGISTRITKKNEQFRKNGIICKLSVIDGIFKIHLPLDPDDKQYPLSKYHQEDMSNDPQYEDSPFTLDIKSKIGFKRAFDLLEEVIISKEITKNDDYKDEKFEELLQIDGEAIFEKLGYEHYLIYEYKQETFDKFIKENPDGITLIRELLPSVSVKAKSRKYITKNVYIDTVLPKLGGNVISLQKLTSKRIIDKDSSNISVGIRGKLNVAITVICNSITDNALFAVLSTRGIVNLVK